MKPQHLAPSDAMVFLQTLKACDAAVVNESDTITLKASWNTPITHLPKELSMTASLGDLLAGEKPRLAKGKAIAAYADALQTGTAADLTKALDAAQAASSSGTDPELQEIVALIQAHPALSH